MSGFGTGSGFGGFGSSSQPQQTSGFGAGTTGGFGTTGATGGLSSGCVFVSSFSSLSQISGCAVRSRGYTLFWLFDWTLLSSFNTAHGK